MGKSGQHLHRGLLPVRRGSLDHYHPFLSKGTVQGTWVWTQPFVGIRTRAGRLPHAVLPPVETLQAASFTNQGRGEAPQAPPRPLPHEYLTMEEVRAPTLPQRNPARPGVYPDTTIHPGRTRIQ